VFPRDPKALSMQPPKGRKDKKSRKGISTTRGCLEGHRGIWRFKGLRRPFHFGKVRLLKASQRKIEMSERKRVEKKKKGGKKGRRQPWERNVYKVGG